MNRTRKLLALIALVAGSGCGKDGSPEPTGVVSYNIRVSPSPAVTVDQSAFVFVSANLVFQTGLVVDGRKIDWAIDDPSIAYFSVLRDTMVSVWGAKVGTTTLTASSGAYSAKISVTVKPAVVAKVYLAPRYLAVEKGTSRSLGVTVFTAQQTEIRNPAIQWKSSNPTVATVDQNGSVTGLSFGSADITATVDTVTVAATVYVPTPFVSVTAGFGHACALKADGRAFCWGTNDQGQLGDGTTEKRPLPTVVSTSVRFKSIHALAGATCGLVSDGTLYCWGRNFFGQLGLGGVSSITTPTPVLTSVRFNQIAAGGVHICGITTDGQTYCWGQGRAAGAATAPDVITAPTLVQGAPAFSSIHSGLNFSCGLSEAGAAYCWGVDFFGQLGDSVPERTNAIGTGRNEPMPVVGGLKFASLNTSPYSSHACGIRADSKAFCWGDYVENNSASSTFDCLTNPGIAGISRCTPYPIPVSGGVSFKQIAPAFGGRCGIDLTGHLYCWGTFYEAAGQITYAVPKSLPSQLTFTSIAAGWYHYCGVTSTGSVYCWGYNGNGELGDYSGVPWLPPTMPSGRYFSPDPSLIAAP